MFRKFLIAVITAVAAILETAADAIAATLPPPAADSPRLRVVASGRLCLPDADRVTVAAPTRANGRRPHRSRQLLPPRPDHPVADLSYERIKRRPVLGGPINEYEQTLPRSPGQDRWPSSGTRQARHPHDSGSRIPVQLVNVPVLVSEIDVLAAVVLRIPVEWTAEGRGSTGKRG